MPDAASADFVARLAADPDTLELILPICRAYLNASRHPSFSYKPWATAARNQLAFHQSTCATRVVIGGNQSGKSFCASHELKWWFCGDHPYQKTPKAPVIWVISAQYETIENGIYRHLKAILPPWSIKRWMPLIPSTNVPRGVESVTGAKIRFYSAKGDSDSRRKTAAAAVDLVSIDEEIGDDVFVELLARRLTTGGKMVITTTAIDSNDWLIGLEDRYATGDPRVFLTRFDTREALKAGHIDKGALEDLEASLSSDEDYGVRIRGETRSSHGRVYDEFDVAKHTVAPFKIPPDWARFMALDPGVRTFACLWAAVEPNGRIYVYRELYEHGRTAREMAGLIYLAEGYKHNPDYEPQTHEEWGTIAPSQQPWLFIPEHTEVITARYIDPAESTGLNPSGEPRTAEILSTRYALECISAINAVEPGIDAVKFLLQDRLDGRPSMLIFANMLNTLKEIKSYRRAPPRGGRDRPEREASPIKRRDHLMDALRYLVMARISPNSPGQAIDQRAVTNEYAPPLFLGLPLYMRQRSQTLWGDFVESVDNAQNPPHHFGLGTEY